MAGLNPKAFRYEPQLINRIETFSFVYLYAWLTTVGESLDRLGPEAKFSRGIMCFAGAQAASSRKSSTILYLLLTWNKKMQCLI